APAGARAAATSGTAEPALTSPASSAPARLAAPADDGGGLQPALLAQIGVMSALALYVAWPALRRLQAPQRPVAVPTRLLRAAKAGKIAKPSGGGVLTRALRRRSR
ncbi:MAG: hypothetical protein M3P96_10550, partial [Actinomycetota bacterium]|nr:hypothetical protein [Actinomycetota bacterium]